MKIDYLQLLKDSAQFTWKYKILWIFGFILALFSGGGGGNSGGGGSSSDYSGSSTSSGSESFDRLGASIDKFISSPYFWLMVIIGIIIILLLIILSWYLTTVSKVALMNAYMLDQQGKEEDIQFGKLWKSTNPYLLKILLFDLVWIAITIPVIILFILFIISFIIPPLGLILTCCLGVPLLIIYIIIASAMQVIGMRLIVLEEMGVWKSIAESWGIFKSNVLQFIVAWLVQLVPSIILGLITLCVTFTILLPFMIFTLALLFNQETLWVGISVGICGVCGLSIVVALVEAPIKVLIETYWTKFILLLRNKSF